MFPILPVVLLAGGLGALGVGLLSSSSGGSSGPSGSNGPGSDGLLRGTPPELTAATRTLAQNGRDPAGMERMAGLLDQYGYQDLSGLLRSSAANLGRPQQPSIPQAPNVLPPMPDLNGGMPNFPAIPPLPPVIDLRGIPGNPIIPEPAPEPLPAPTPQPQTATVTASNVQLRPAIGITGSGPTLSPGGMPPNSVVRVLNWNAGSASGYEWAQVQAPQGVGFIAKNYLQLNPTVGAEASFRPRKARCVSPGGCRLREEPSSKAPFLGNVDKGEPVLLLKHHKGPKAVAGSPSPGGWGLVKTRKGNMGWLPSEWLV